MLLLLRLRLEQPLLLLLLHLEMGLLRVPAARACAASGVHQVGVEYAGVVVHQTVGGGAGRVGKKSKWQHKGGAGW